MSDSGAITDAEETRAVSPVAMATPPAPAGMEFSRGAQVGRLVLLDRIGSGGLGDVYAAYDPQLHRQVAVKVVRPSTADADGDGGTARLIREAQAMAQLQHPNVVAVYDVGHVDEAVFISMEKIDGVTLGKWRAEPRTWQEIRSVFCEAGHGLAAAHAAGLVHRDFKPANVLVSSDGRVRVLDFGLARFARSSDDPAESLPNRGARDETPRSSGQDWDAPVTRDGLLMGTPAYMAPEQFEGSGSLGPPADQFAFCVALWESLYDQKPFASRDFDELYKLVRAGDVSEPDDRRSVPRWIHDAMLRGLSPEPADRWPSMTELLDELRRDLRARRRGSIGAIVAGVVSAGVTAAALTLVQPEPTQSERDEIAEVVNDARAAAARNYYVYPPHNDPQTPTAYQAVETLEGWEGDGSALAADEASALRDEFAETLVRLGDEYWDREGGMAFASEYYAMSLVFEPDDEHARKRTMLTPSELALLRQRASDVEFGDAELAAAESLVVLAERDPDARTERLAKWMGSGAGPSTIAAARIETLLPPAELDAARAKTQPRARPREPARAAPAPKGDRGPEAKMVTPEAPPSSAPRQPEDPPKRDPKQARALVKRGLRAASNADFEAAESFFHQALEHDDRSDAALAGLAEVHFDLGHYQKTISYGKRAARLAPKKAPYRITLGDAYFRTNQYPLARREYTKAAELGHARAKARLQQLKARLGD